MTTTQILARGLLLSAFLLAGRATGEETAPLTKVPASIAEMKDFQKKVQEVTKKITPAVVGVQVGGASGSGVIINEEGIVLTAGHVSGKPDQDVILIMPDGKRLKGKTLGANRKIDSGMIKITDKGGPWPHVEMGKSETLKKGQWVISLGHPNGYYEHRKPVLRVGRIQNVTGDLIQTDSPWWAATPAAHCSTLTAR